MTRPPEYVYIFGIFQREIRNNRLTATHFCLAKARTSSDLATLSRLPRRGRRWRAKQRFIRLNAKETIRADLQHGSQCTV